MKQTNKRVLKLSRESVRVLSSRQLTRAGGGFIPDPTTAATDGNNGCPSEATGCHTGLSGCGSC